MPPTTTRVRIPIQDPINPYRKKPTLGQPWPTRGQWTQHKKEIDAARLRHLGIAIEEDASGGIVMASHALKVLGRDLLVEFPAVSVPGKVLWCNFDLARQLGFTVSPANVFTPELRGQLSSLSRQATTPNAAEGERQTIMYADKYGGDGLGIALGAGRAGFLTRGNLYVKGIGFTPLFRHDDKDDFAHSHGGVHLDDCLVEAVFGEVNENLFSHGSSRILAVIDQGKVVIDPRGRRIPIGIAVRAGSQLRPAHLLTRLRSKDSQLERFIEITRASGQLVTRMNSSGVELPDIKATMLRIIRDHAETAAEGFRWRMIHGALSASNMEISGAMLDLPTQSTQPRTAPVWLLKYADSIFGFEHLARALHLAPVYRKLLRNVPKSEWSRMNIGPIDFKNEMLEAYAKALQLQLLTAVGLKKDLAQKIQAKHSSLVESFSQLLVEMSALRNRGSLCVARATVEQVAVLDVFNLLGRFPAAVWADPSGDHRAAAFEFLKPCFRGNRFHVAKRRETVNSLIERFADLYLQLINVCRGYADEFYGGVENLATSLSARAAFENQPLEHLYSHRLFGELRKAIRNYQATGNPGEIRMVLDEGVTASLRSVEALLRQGSSRYLSSSESQCGVTANEGIELQMRTFEGINCSVRAWNDEGQTRLLHINIPIERDGVNYITAVPAFPRLSKRQLESLHFSFRIENSNLSRTVKGRLVQDASDGLVLNFELPCPLYLVGRLNGKLWLRVGKATDAKEINHSLEGYVFAIPDRQEVMSMAAQAR